MKFLITFLLLIIPTLSLGQIEDSGVQSRVGPSFIESGTWTPSDAGSASNLTGSPSYGTSTYQRIGNMVFAQIALITGYSTTSANTRTFFRVNTTGLPGITNPTIFFGGVTTHTSPAGEVKAGCVADSGANQVLACVYRSNGTGGTTITQLHFRYEI